MSKASPVRMVVNADDLGGSAAVNDAVFECIAERVVTSATLMANGPAFGAAVQTARGFAGASFGVHLNVTQFEPLTSTSALRALLGPDGAFEIDAVYRVSWTLALVRAVADEWSAQVARVRDSGIPVSHLDSHHHSHTLPGLFLALKTVQKRFGIRRVRGTWSIYERARVPSLALRWKKRFWLQAVRRVYATRTPDEFAGLEMFLRAVAEHFYLPRVWPRTIELMVHPDGDPVASGAETAALRSGWIDSLPFPGRLTTYNDL